MKSQIGFLLVLSAYCYAVELGASEKIVGGSYAEKDQFPHQIGLMYYKRLRCGGSILSRTWVLTAAHCVENVDVKSLWVCAGTNSLLDCQASRNVAQSIIHENYRDFKNDIAVIRLESSLEFTQSIKPIEIANEEVPVYSEVIISGWGRTSTWGGISEKLKFNTVQVVTNCLVNYIGILCLGHKKNNGACNGDSGGSAIYQNKLVGVANFVVSGCGSEYPDGYAKVSYFTSWIRDKTTC